MPFPVNYSVDRHVLLSLLAAGSFAVAPHALELPAWVIAVFIVSAAWRYGIEAYQWYRPGKLVRFGLMLIILVAMLRQYHTLLGRDPGMALLITLIGLKFLELKTTRDFVVSLFVFYLIILGNFLYGQSLWLGAWALLAAGVSTAALVHLTQPTGLDMLQRLRLSGVMLAKAVPLMLIVYLLFPRINGTLWGLPADAHSGLTGMSDTMQPGSIRSLSESSEIAFRVNFDAAPPPARELYWRGLVLTEFDGRGWQRGQTQRMEDISFVPLNDSVRYHVTLEPSNKPWMPALELPVIRPKGARYQTDFTLEHREPIRERLNYTLTSYTRYRTGALDSTERARALRLPRNVSPRTRALAAQWQRENSNAQQVAQAALDHFRRENFVYTLSPPLLGDDPVDEFLFGTRRGFCEHYAAAFVTLMRAVGIPSRVVVGYLGGELNTAGNYMIVRQSDAHAWAEIWLTERGWVRVDPTGAIAPERIELGLDAVRRLEQQGLALGSLSNEAVLRALELGWFEVVARNARWYWDYTNIAWYRWVVDYGKERQERFLTSLGFDDISWGRLTGLLTAGVLLITLLYALLLLRSKKYTDPALALYLRFCRKLARAGLKRAPHEGAHAFAGRAARKRTDLADSISEITNLYEELRYGRTMSDRKKFISLKKRIAAFRA
ncbi:MAG: protein-glutamine gamma-glutamyltransferase TgpA [Sulfuricaulis sp.]